MTAAPAPSIEPLAKDHHRKSFICGAEPLDRYLQTRASQDVKGRVAAAFMLTEPPDRRVLGFYTLSSSTMALSDLPEKFAKKLPRYPQLPATLIGRLAVDVSVRGKRYGELLLMDALRRSLEAAAEIGAMAVIVDAKDDGAAAFYQQYGFVPLPGHERRMFLPMGQVAAIFS